MIGPVHIEKVEDWYICDNHEHMMDLMLYGGCRLCHPKEYENAWLSFLNRGRGSGKTEVQDTPVGPKDMEPKRA